MRMSMWFAPAVAVGILMGTAFLASQAQVPTQAPKTLDEAQQLAKSDSGVGHYFTEAQARRGEELYNRHCGYCHFANGSQKPTMSGIRGQQLAPALLTREASGITRFPSAYYLYERIAYMPPNDVDSITRQQRTDIVAYLLRQNGLSAGTSELQSDDSHLRGAILPAEPGFDHVFNGRNFDGWKFMFGYHCTLPPEGCARTDPTGIFSVKDGALVTTGRIHGLAYTTRRFKNFTLRMEQRITKPWDDLDELIQDQTGIMIFLDARPDQPYRTWSNYVEIEGKYHEISRISLPNATLDEEARQRVLKPVNQWQQMQVVVQGRSIKSYLNRALISTAELPDDLPPGFIGVQSQGGPVEWRNIRIRED